MYLEACDEGIHLPTETIGLIAEREMFSVIVT
jgi:hypothetical protein